MDVWEATVAEAETILSFVQFKAEFDRGLGAFTGRLGTSVDLIRQHLFGPQPRACVLFAGARERPVGFALYYFRYSSFQGRPSVWLDDLLVRVEDRRGGAGRRLIGRLAAIAVAADCTHIAWVASGSNVEGMGFYSQLGATEVHRDGDAVTLQFPAAHFPRLIAQAESFTTSTPAKDGLRP